jgi:hypothetical protein
VQHLNDLVEFLGKLETQGWTVHPKPSLLHQMELWGFDVADE